MIWEPVLLILEFAEIPEKLNQIQRIHKWFFPIFIKKQFFSLGHSCFWLYYFTVVVVGLRI